MATTGVGSLRKCSGTMIVCRDRDDWRRLRQVWKILSSLNKAWKTRTVLAWEIADMVTSGMDNLLKVEGEGDVS